MGTKSGTNEENEHQGQLQDAILQHPPVVLHTAGVTGGDVGPERHDSGFAEVKEEEWEGPEPARMKERELELQLPHVKEEEQEVPFIGIVVKREDDVSQQQPESPQAKEEEEDELTEMPPTGKEGLQREEAGGTGPLSCSSMAPEGGRGHPGRSRADGLFAPLSDHRHGIWHSRNNHEDDGGHSGSISCPTDNMRWTCCQCDKTFEAKYNFKMHTGEKALACSLCSQGAPLTNIQEKHFACSVCHFKFRKRCNLKAHIRTHTGEKPFACSVCDKRFTEKGHLRTHSRTHTGEKPFACSVCEQRFSEKGSLRKHARTHSGEKPFACLVCAKTFAQKGHLRRHSRTHTGEKPFSCNVCAKRFANKYQVTIHHCAGEKSSGHQASKRQ